MTNTEISVYIGSRDRHLFEAIWAQGIDSRLEAFVESTNEVQGDRWLLSIVPEELQILIRRLYEYATDYAEQWADDIVRIVFGVEIV